MTLHSVFVTAVGPEPVAAPDDIAGKLISRAEDVHGCSRMTRHEDAYTFIATVEADDLASAVGRVKQLLAQGPWDISRRFCVTGHPLDHTPAIGGL